eukprot:363795-Chlamydomonas_euryale.AAC.1
MHALKQLTSDPNVPRCWYASVELLERHPPPAMQQGLSSLKPCTSLTCPPPLQRPCGSCAGSVLTPTGMQEEFAGGVSLNA